MSQIAFFTRDGDMRVGSPRYRAPKRGALIRATILLPGTMGYVPVGSFYDTLPGKATALSGANKSCTCPSAGSSISAAVVTCRLTPSIKTSTRRDEPRNVTPLTCPARQLSWGPAPLGLLLSGLLGTILMFSGR